MSIRPTQQPRSPRLWREPDMSPVRYFHGYYSSQLANGIPPTVPGLCCTRLSTYSRPYPVHLCNARVERQFRSFISFTYKLCHFLALSSWYCFPPRPSRLEFLREKHKVTSRTKLLSYLALSFCLLFCERQLKPFFYWIYVFLERYPTHVEKYINKILEYKACSVVYIFFLCV